MNWNDPYKLPDTKLAEAAPRAAADRERAVAFFRNEYRRKLGTLTYEESYACDWFPLQRRLELEQTLEIARGTAPRTIAYIGTSSCAGLYHWLKALPTVEACIACDIYGFPCKDLFEDHWPLVKFLWLDSSSYHPFTVSLARGWLRELGTSGRYARARTIDCLYLDGDKGGFVDDWEAYTPLMSPEGLVFIHDICETTTGGNGNPRRCYMLAKHEGYRTEEIVDMSEAEEALGRQGEGLPVANGYEEWLRHWGTTSCGVGVVYLGEKEDK